MSASERLRELDMGPPGMDDAELGIMGYDGLLALRNALPLIADVVEAAEPLPRIAEERVAGWASREEIAPLAVALTALREHLEGQ